MFGHARPQAKDSARRQHRACARRRARHGFRAGARRVTASATAGEEIAGGEA